MRILHLMWLALAACQFDPATDVSFLAPLPHVVVRGESVAGIAARYGIPESDLRDWNQISSSELQIGRLLHVWPARPDPSLASVIGRTPPRPAVARTRPARRGASRTAEIPMEELVADPRPVDAAETIWTRESGLLGVAAVAGPDLSTLRVNSLASRGNQLGNAGLSGRTGSVGATGSVDDLTEAFALRGLGETAPRDGRFVPSGAVAPPVLSKPAPKRCVSAGSGADMGDNEIAGSVGLSSSQVRSSLSAFSSKAARCIPSGTTGSFRPVLGMNVGCDGRVSRTWLVEAGGLPPTVTGCLVKTLEYAGFPAHDLPDGLEISWPMVVDR